MTDISKLVNSIANVVETVGPLLGPAGETAAAATKALENLVATAKGIAAPVDQAKLDATLASLQQQVNQHANSTIASLRGNAGGGGGTGSGGSGGGG